MNPINGAIKVDEKNDNTVGLWEIEKAYSGIPGRDSTCTKKVLR